MGMIWTGHRTNLEQAQRFADGLVQEDAATLDALDALTEAEPDSTLDVDKAWHAIDRLYAEAKATSPISTGRVKEAPDVVVGLCAPERVTAIATGMGRITPAVLRRGYDAKRFAREGIYPDIWDEDDVLDVYVMPYDAELRDFYRAAAEAGQAIVWHVS